MNLRDTLYIKVSKNSITVRNVCTQSELTANAEFTTNRLLIGNFSCAEKLLKKLLSQVAAKGLLKLPPMVVIHRLEMTEGGLAQIEQRIFMEIALGSGARKAIVHTGELLSDAAVKHAAKT